MIIRRRMVCWCLRTWLMTFSVGIQIGVQIWGTVSWSLNSITLNRLKQVASYPESREFVCSMLTVADPGFHPGSGTGSLGSPNGDQRDWERGGDQRDGRSVEINETRQASRRLVSERSASKFTIPESPG
jgi:hypothetical protein